MGPGDASWPHCSTPSHVLLWPGQLPNTTPLWDPQAPSLRFPSPLLLLFPNSATRRVESFFSYQPRFTAPPPWLHSNWEQNSWQERVDLSVYIRQFTRQREEVPQQGPRRQGRVCKQERGLKGPQRKERSQEGTEACAVAVGEREQKCWLDQRHQGEFRHQLSAQPPAQRPAWQETLHLTLFEASTCRCSGREACSGI